MSWKYLESCLNEDVKFQTKKSEINTYLLESCANNKIKHVLNALWKGAFVDCDDGIYTPLMLAVDGGSIELAKVLLDFKANPLTLVLGKDAIWLSLKKQKYDFLDLFFKTCGKMRLNRDVETKQTLLISAVLQSDLTAVKIIAPNVNVNEKDTSGNTALHYNLSKKSPTQADVEIGRLLVALGADTKTRNLDGETPASLVKTREAEMVMAEKELADTLPQPKPSFNNKGFKNQKSRKFKM